MYIGGVNKQGIKLTSGQKFSVIYHNIFDFPLTKEELTKWTASSNLISNIKYPNIDSKDGYYFLKGREELTVKRLARGKITKRKMEIAQKAARVLESIPTIRLIGVTGALAMKNTLENSDIDLLIVTSRSSLWITRLVSYILLGLLGFKIRKPGDGKQKDRLCLNMWLDETSLVWPKKLRSIYTAHEYGQLLILVNKNNIYEYMLYKNNWVIDFWPNVANIYCVNYKLQSTTAVMSFLNQFAYRIEKLYMQGKITNEVVTPTRAIFHPVDWSERMRLALQKKGIMF